MKGPALPAWALRSIGWCERAGDRELAIATAIALVLGLALAPWWSFELDTLRSFLPWSRATGGLHPWDAYLRGGCVYPPIVPYWLTVVEGLRKAFGASEVSPWAIAWLKFPNVLACAAGVVICRWGLVRSLGVAAARQAALAYLLCMPLWLNAVLWGQFDALLALALVSAVVAMMADRPAWAGAAIGIALAIKLQGGVVGPCLLLYAWRRGGRAGAARFCLAAALALGLAAAPDEAAGAGPALLSAYTTAVDFFPRVSMGAFNGWFIIDVLDRLREPQMVALPDDRVLWGLLTLKRLGLIIFAGYLLDLLASVWRRPDPQRLASAAALAAFAFFMLPTQMHERYLVPAAALLAIAAWPGRARGLFIGVCLTASANQAFVFAWFDLRFNSLTDGRELLALGVAAANVALFWFGSRAFWRAGAEGASLPAGEAPL